MEETEWKHGTEEVENNAEIEKKKEKLQQKGAHFLIKRQSVRHWDTEEK